MSDIASELAKLHTLAGAEFIIQLKRIAAHSGFHPLEGETNIFVVGGEQGNDFDNLLNAARKAVMLGYKVYVLPNPKGIRTADFIFEQNGVYKMYDLKTIHGVASVGSRLKESIGQTNRVLLNITTNYNTRSLAFALKRYFEQNPEAIEVLIFKGRKHISIDRFFIWTTTFFRTFKKRYET